MVRDVAFPVVLRWNCSAVSCADILTTYSVIIPFCDSTVGGVQFTNKVLASTAVSAILIGAAEGTVRRGRGAVYKYDLVNYHIAALHKQ